MTSRQDTALRDRLAATELFGGLAAERLDELLPHVSERRLAAQEHLFFEGRPAEHFDIVVSGMVKAGHGNAGGDVVAFGLFGPGETLGIGPALNGGRFPAHAVALTEEVVALRVQAGPVLRSLREDLAFSRALNGLLVRHAQVLQAKIDIVGAGAVPRRLATLLLYLIRRFGSRDPGGAGRTDVALTREQISELVGARIETVIRILSRWQKAGWLSSSGQGFLVARIDMLERILLE